MSKLLKVSDGAAFDKAVWLIKNKYFQAPDLRVERDGGTDIIVYGDDRYVKVGGGMTRASETTPLVERFRCLYADERDKVSDAAKANAKWNFFLSSMTDAFYDKYSLLVYEPLRSDDTSKEYIDGVKRFFDAVKLGRQVFVESAPPRAVKVCKVAVKLSFDLGGMPFTAIVPFYFSISDDFRTVRIMDAVAARDIHQQIGSMKSEPSSKRAAAQSGERRYSALADKIMTSLNEVFAQSKDDTSEKSVNLLDYLVIEGEIKTQLLSFVRSRMQLVGSNEELSPDLLTECLPNETINVDTPQIRYIALLDYYCARAECFDSLDRFERKKLYDIEFDSTGRFAVKCGKCGTQIFDFKEAGVLASLIASDPKIATDKSRNPLLQHAQIKRCLGGKCVRLVCDGDIFVTKPDGGRASEEYCIDCHRPELVAHVVTPSGTKRVAISEGGLVYCRDTMTLMLRNDATTCPVCLRSYSRQGTDGRYCTFCAPIVKASGGELSKYRKLFARNSHLLPHSMRLGKHNLCNEDNEFILFRIKDKLYRVDKRQLTPTKAAHLEYVVE